MFTPAFAQAATAAGPTSADILMQLVPFALIFAITVAQNLLQKRLDRSNG